MWGRYSKKLNTKIDNYHCVGIFDKVQSEERGMRFLNTSKGAISEGELISFYWMVDPDDGAIVDVRFQLYGPSILIGIAQTICELAIGKNYDQVSRVSVELIDKHLRDHPQTAAFPPEVLPHIHMVLEAMQQIADRCKDIPLASNYIAMPAPLDIGEVLEGGYPGWENLSNPQKIALIEEVIARDIRPYIELDAGGVKIIDLINGNELLIAYQGSCTSCFAATGSTLSYIQHVLRSKVHPQLQVIPDLSGHS